jgi:hypothetical protein
MASKIMLGKRPASFNHTVKFPMLDGTEGSIACVFKYRTRKEFGVFIDGIMEAAGMTPQADGEKFSMATLMEKTAGANADYILQVLDGWNLEEELSRASLEQLADEIPAATTAIMEQYRVAITEGRLGN